MRLDNKKYISPFWDINCSRNSHASDVCEIHTSDYRDYGCEYCNIFIIAFVACKMGYGQR